MPPSRSISASSCRPKPLQSRPHSCKPTHQAWVVRHAIAGHCLRVGRYCRFARVASTWGSRLHYPSGAGLRLEQQLHRLLELRLVGSGESAIRTLILRDGSHQSRLKVTRLGSLNRLSGGGGHFRLRITYKASRTKHLGTAHGTRRTAHANQGCCASAAAENSNQLPLLPTAYMRSERHTAG